MRVSNSTKKILVVDDDERVCRVIRDILIEERYEVLVANGAEEALKIFDNNPPPVDLLVTDVIMPKMNGVDLADRLALAQPGLPVLFISGVLEGKLLQRERKQEIMLLEKPFLPVELVSKVRQLLSVGAARAAR
jgi:DNA-binding NtrC family response regulator